MTESAQRPDGPEAHQPPPGLVFDDPLGDASRDDSDEGWGERPATPGGGAADLARFLEEKPPHHL